MNALNQEHKFFFIFLLNKKKKLKAVLRGFRVLKATNRLGLWEDLRSKFLESNPLSGTVYSKYFFGDAHSNGNYAIHQFCIDRILRLWLGKQILIHAKYPKFKIIWPLPTLWINLLNRENIPVNFILSSILWVMFIIALYSYNLIKIFKILLKVNPFFNSDSGYRLNKFYYFDKIFPQNIPKYKNCKNYDLLTWFINSNIRNESISHITHNVEGRNISIDGVSIEYDLLPYEMKLSFKNFLKLLGWLIYSITYSLIDLLRMRWCHPVMLFEATKLKIVGLTDSSNIAVEYFFHWSSGVYRPLWTYSAQKKGAEITLYFYSTIESPALLNRRNTFKSQYWLMNWPKYLCWNDRQRKIIEENVANAKFDIVGPIWFSDNPSSCDESLNNYAAVFCVENFRKPFYIGISSLTDYFEYNPSLPVLFLKDIHHCCENLEIILAHKRKRNDERRELKRYKKIISDLNASPYYHNVSVENSTIRVIEKARFVICFPFTSVAVQAQYMGKKVAYYDPVCWLDKNDPASNGVPILQGKNELHSWMVENG